MPEDIMRNLTQDDLKRFGFRRDPATPRIINRWVGEVKGMWYSSITFTDDGGGTVAYGLVMNEARGGRAAFVNTPPVVDKPYHCIPQDGPVTVGAFLGALKHCGIKL